MTNYTILPPSQTFEVRPIENYKVVFGSNSSCTYKDKDGNLVCVCLNDKTISYCPADESHKIFDEDGHFHGKNFKITRKINKKNPNEKMMLDILKNEATLDKINCLLM